MICINREERKPAFTTDRAHHSTHQRLCRIEDSSTPGWKDKLSWPSSPQEGIFLLIISSEWVAI